MPRFVRDNGLSLAFIGIFLVTLVAQSFAGHAAELEELARHGQPPVSYLDFVSSSSFLVDVAENWQSEFLAVAAMVTFAIFLRQRGSSESKPVGTPHHTTSVEAE